jgi:hypothetical protein
MYSSDLATVGAKIPMPSAARSRNRDDRVPLRVFEDPQHGRSRAAQSLDLAPVVVDNC